MFVLITYDVNITSQNEPSVCEMLQKFAKTMGREFKIQCLNAS